jgi:hypothetical protein
MSVGAGVGSVNAPDTKSPGLNPVGGEMFIAQDILLTSSRSGTIDCLQIQEV